MRQIRVLCRSKLPLDVAAVAVRVALFVAGGLVGLGGQAVLARTVAPEVRTLMMAEQTVVGEPIVYPSAEPARITAREIILYPGQSLPWHSHPMPTFGYIIEGKIEVDYGSKGRRTFGPGDTLMEAQAHVHAGRNTSDQPVRVLAVSIGSQGQPLSVLAPAQPE